MSWRIVSAALQWGVPMAAKDFSYLSVSCNPLESMDFAGNHEILWIYKYHPRSWNLPQNVDILKYPPQSMYMAAGYLKILHRARISQDFLESPAKHGYHENLHNFKDYHLWTLKHFSCLLSCSFRGFTLHCMLHWSCKNPITDKNLISSYQGQQASCNTESVTKEHRIGVTNTTCWTLYSPYMYLLLVKNTLSNTECVLLLVLCKICFCKPSPNISFYFGQFSSNSKTNLFSNINSKIYPFIPLFF